MGQKTHPVGFRLGVVRGWSSKWYSEKDFSKWLHEDLRLKKFVKQKLNHAGVAAVEVERAANKVKINIFTARPGIVIGKRGAGVETLKDRKSTRLNSSHLVISYAVFCLKKKKKKIRL